MTIDEKLIKEREEKEKRDERFRIKFSWWGTKIVSISIIAYLLFSVFAAEKYRPRNLSNQDIALICVVLLFNAGIIEKLSSFTIDGGKLEAKFDKLDKLEKQVDKNEEDINTLQQRRIEEIQELQKLLYQGFLNGYEYWTLYNLDRRNDEQVNDYHYSILGRSQLRNLHSINFIDLQDGKSFKDFKDDQYISYPDLRNCFSVTLAGKNYLDQMKKMGINPRIV